MGLFRMERVKARRYIGTMAAVVLGVAVVDQAVKQLMLSILTEGEALPVIGDWFRFYLLFNPGAAFSMGGEGSTCLLYTSPSPRDRG